MTIKTKLSDAVVYGYTTVASFTIYAPNKQRGVTAIEYGVMAAGLALALSVLFSADGEFISGLKNAFNGIAEKMNVGGK